MHEGWGRSHSNRLSIFLEIKVKTRSTRSIDTNYLSIKKFVGKNYEIVDISDAIFNLEDFKEYDYFTEFTLSIEFNGYMNKYWGNDIGRGLRDSPDFIYGGNFMSDILYDKNLLLFQLEYTKDNLSLNNLNSFIQLDYFEIDFKSRRHNHMSRKWLNFPLKIN